MKFKLSYSSNLMMVISSFENDWKKENWTELN